MSESDKTPLVALSEPSKIVRQAHDMVARCEAIQSDAWELHLKLESTSDGPLACGLYLTATELSRQLDYLIQMLRGAGL